MGFYSNLADKADKKLLSNYMPKTGGSINGSLEVSGNITCNGTNISSIKSMDCTINTSNFISSNDSWVSVRVYGHIAVCNFSLTTAKEFKADSEYNICKLSTAAIHPARSSASCGGNITGDVSIQDNALSNIKIAPKSTLASGKTVKGQIIFFI